MLNPALPPLPLTLVGNTREDELQVLNVLLARRNNRRAGVGLLLFISCVTAIAISLFVFAANWAGWLSDCAFEPVLLTAYVAFCAGDLFLSGAARLQVQRSVRRQNRENGKANKIWQISFKNEGITWISEFYEIRVPWHTIESVEVTRGFVVIWGRLSHFFIPARIFADDAARDTIVATVKARIP
jgi:hypothetical protein